MRARSIVLCALAGAFATTSCLIPGFTTSDPEDGSGGSDTGGSSSTGGGNVGGEGGNPCEPAAIPGDLVATAAQAEVPTFTFELPTGVRLRDGSYQTNEELTLDVVDGALAPSSDFADFFGWDEVVLSGSDGCADVEIPVTLRVSPAAGGPVTTSADGRIEGFEGPLALAAADFDGDDVLDLVVGAPAAESGNGRVYVVFGGASLLRPDLALEDVATSGLPGFVVTGPTGAALGASVSTAGDVNCSGRDSLVLGAPGVGKAFVVFGESSPEALDLATPSERFFEFVGAADAAFGTGISVAGGQDVSGDDVPDLLIGTPTHDAGSTNRGLVSVVFGGFVGCDCEASTSCLTSGQSLTALGTAGFSILGTASSQFTGIRTALIGDVEGDEKSDLAAVRSSNLMFFPGRSTTTDVLVTEETSPIVGNAQSPGRPAAPASGFRAGDDSDFDDDDANDYVFCRTSTSIPNENSCDVVVGDGSPVVVAGFASPAGVQLSVEYLGRSNDDTRGDLIVTERDRAFVVFGTTSNNAIDASDLGEGGYVLEGDVDATFVPQALGDLDGDGFADFALADTTNGVLYVVRGGP